MQAEVADKLLGKHYIKIKMRAGVKYLYLSVLHYKYGIDGLVDKNKFPDFKYLDQAGFSRSVAIGFSATASNCNSIAIGCSATASSSSVAIGYGKNNV